MLSLASLLNPAPPRPPVSCFPASPMSTSPAMSFADEPLSDRNSTPKNKMSKQSAGLTKSKAKGIVNFYPFETLDPESLQEARKFVVSPLGSIQNYCRHIPYNSGKKDFYEKTGRESFEVFQYRFKAPGDDSEYTVMWDYNVGLVRMTPFFKCCKYSKTTPAKMLNMNPGLRDITHSITGGSIMAQGYWMPFSCAKAVCATFCHHIAGALIPIFGPKFPAECIHPESPDHGRMIIDPAIVAGATREADMFRRMYTEQSNPPSGSPISHRRSLRLPDYDSSQYERRQRFRKGMIIDSPCATDTDNDGPLGHEAFRPDFPPTRYQFSPVPPLRTSIAASRWRVANQHHPTHPHPHPRPHPAPHGQFYRDEQQYPGANPWLSAVPRFAALGPRRQLPPSSHPIQGAPPASPQSPLWGSKRPAEYMDADYEYDAGESQAGSSPTTSRGDARDDEDHPRQLPAPVSTASSGAEKNAALLLMNLSMGEADKGEVRVRSEGGHSMPTPESMDMHRSKRRRATSM